MDGGMHNGQRSLWDILDTEPTGDERALKRAYAKRLKVTRPEDDPAAFQELREAYEYALRHAHQFSAELQEQGQAEETAEAQPASLTADMAKAGTPSAEAAELWGVIDDAGREMGAEDFSFMLEARPGAYLFIGNGDTAGLHHPGYDFADEAAPAGASFFARVVERTLPLEARHGA